MSVYINKCRICGSKSLKKILNLEKMPLGDKYASKPNLFNERVAIDILRCQKCDHIQNSTVPDSVKLYSNYLSRPASINTALSGEYLIYAKDLLKYLNKDDSVMDIGSNDGLFLSFFKKNGIRRILGIEPANNLAKLANKRKIPTLNLFFNNDASIKALTKYNKKFKIILNNHSLSNINDIQSVLRNVKSSLDDKGIYSIQTFYPYDVFNKKLLENFNHEHLGYFFVKTIDYLAKLNGLEVIDVFRVPAKGGSIRMYLSHMGDRMVKQSVFRTIKMEQKFLNSKKYISQVSDFIQLNKNYIKKIISSNKFKKIVGYGTSIGATTFITQYNLGKKINFLIDDDSYRQNRYSPGFNILTKSNDIIRTFKPDLIIIFAPLYADAIIKKIKIKFGSLVPILLIWPKVKLIKKY